MPHDALICTCGAIHMLDILKAPVSNSEWKAIYKCPICWARKKATNTRIGNHETSEDLDAQRKNFENYEF